MLLIHNSGIGQMIKVEEWEAYSEMITCAFRYDENKSPGNSTLFEISLKGLTCMENQDVLITM